jgi:hypothetical protein
VNLGRRLFLITTYSQSMKKWLLGVLCTGLLTLAANLEAQLFDLVFHPDYRLPGRAANQIGPRPTLPRSNFSVLDWSPSAPLLFGQAATECLDRFLPAGRLPEPPYSVETWALYHVNRPVGFSLLAGTPDAPDWVSGQYGSQLLLGTIGKEGWETDTIPAYRGWNRYWLHQVTVVTADSIQLYQNGVLRASRPRPAARAIRDLRLCFYLEEEPYMDAANLLKRLRIYDRALTPEEQRIARAELTEEVEKGLLLPDRFHFNAGPYLHLVDSTGVNITWETDRPARSARVYFGSELPLVTYREVELAGAADGAPDPIQVYRLDQLTPAMTYFYEIEVTDAAGDTIRSGALTFATAPATNEPYAFAVLGDTEARPHINHQLAKLIWDERPAFLLNLGDLTDGGQEGHKFEWNYEYFLGMDALTGRIPVFSVPGNGESDLYWYNRYHRYPDLGDAYTFRYGDVAFFMLNSNRKAEFAPGGRQYEWLRDQLAACTARWKIVCHHHAPYSSDEDDYGDSWSGPSVQGDTAVRRIVPLYEKFGVDIVFFGHLHTYQRTLPIRKGQVDRHHGVTYVQGGGGGGNLEDFAPTRAWFSGKTYRGHHYFTVSVSEERLHLRMYDAEGRLRDFWDVER